MSALLPLSVSLQVTEEVLSSRPGGRFLHETRLLRLLSAFGARFPITLPEDPSGGAPGARQGDEMTRLPLFQRHFQRTFRTACRSPSSTWTRSGFLRCALPTATAFPPLATPSPMSSGAFPLSARSCLARLSSSSSPTLL